ncbi:hypothetical protein ABPG77_004680 [Micractinium sp. CCAP 211/92]
MGSPAVKQEPLQEIAIKNEPCSTAVTKEEPGLISTAAAKAEVKSVFGGCGSSGTSMLRAVAYSGPFPGWGAPSAAACHQVVQRLADLHGMPSVQRRASGGRPQVGCEEKRSVLDSLVRTLLSQNTTDITSARAFATLKQQFPTWDAVRAAPPADVADAIRVGGLADIKAARIQAILDTLAAERGACSLEYLRTLPTPQVKAELGRFKGVGKKTASCVLLFALEREDFAVDTHVWEITKALGWVPSNASRDQAYDHLNELVPEELRYDLHVLLVRHGKACPHCAKAGSAKHQAAAASGVACPLADLKPPKSKLVAFKRAIGSKAKGVKSKQQQSSSSSGEAAAAAGAAGGGSKRRKETSH